jgi:hypothetical protein
MLDPRAPRTRRAYFRNVQPDVPYGQAGRVGTPRAGGGVDEVARVRDLKRDRQRAARIELDVGDDGHPELLGLRRVL